MPRDWSASGIRVWAKVICRTIGASTNSTACCRTELALAALMASTFRSTAIGSKSKCLTTQLDWLPTALAVAGVETKSDWQLDGTNLLPLLEGKTDAAPHGGLFWRFGIQYAARQGDWKLLKPSIDDQPMLFNVASDP